jgi:uncharacterized Zn-binding protein involved in type VI secretion
MGVPAAVMGDLITTACVGHMWIPPPPATGGLAPAPPLPFSAPVLVGTVPTVLIQGKPAAVAGNTGVNTPPHVGIHITDPKFAPPSQAGTVVTGSNSVLAGGLPLANLSSTCTACFGPATLAASAATVLVGP